MLELLGAAKILKKPLDDLYELGKDSFKSELGKWKFDKHINELYRYINNFQKVKTIWQFDKEISLKNFYYPSKVIIEGNPQIINSIKKLPNDSNTIIQGIAGQGKSIFMRYLCVQEIKLGTTVPIFIECRKIDLKETLKENIFTVLKIYGFTITEELFIFLCKSGKISLLVDGFDELDPSIINNVIKELEEFSILYPELKIIVSSRPDSGIERSVNFHVYQLARLEPSDLPKILKKLMDDKEKINNIVRVVNKSSTNISSLLITPLMVSLLVIVYKAEQKIPEQFSEFYESLFSTLLYRHDKSKPGYIRARKSNLNERKLQKVFEGFSFIASKHHKTTFTENEISQYIEEAFKYIQIESDVNAVIQDIVKVTNLIVEEGHNYHYIHKSIREFYAAHFIKDRSDDIAEKFYSSMITHYQNWRQEIEFLSQIDKYRYLKFLYIPSSLKVYTMFGIDLESDERRLDYDKLLHFFDNVKLNVNTKTYELPSIHLGNIPEANKYYFEIDLFSMLFSETIDFLKNYGFIKIVHNCMKKDTKMKKEEISLVLLDALVENDLMNDFYNLFNTKFLQYIQKYEENIKFITGEEKLVEAFLFEDNL